MRQVNGKGNDSLITYMTVKIFKGGLNCVSLIGGQLMDTVATDGHGAA
ncbi:hypothetical protein VBApiPXC38_73 [Acinetobacter phage VB_ApiP_XC38]|uniref:Uncharacterized protein n=1 Tax=Acinetobacter phage VB_ApiP_XC38 TaxID=2655002 RepID=A0A5P8PR45_9CAUD|nr:hypothetical protein KNU81_gp73 [Acinetobacter phage VB_ApiP_XC38]QFR59760.1 hypothetical protein VBApiPXC38_73 [Acinetobacter phage VB_ApiP_XC38]